MLSGSRDTPFPLTPETEIGGATLRQIMEHADVALYLDLKPTDPFEASLISLFVRTLKASIYHFNQAERYAQNPHVLEVHSRYALKAASTFALLADRLEKYREKKVKTMVCARNGKPPRGKAIESGAGPAMPMRNGASLSRSKSKGTARGATRSNGRHP